MTQAAHYQRLSLTGSRPGTFHGAETPANFGDVSAELEALRSGAALLDLSWRARIAVTGKDRVRWLHNMVTNNVRDLAPNHGNYNFVLNAQGRILGDLYIFNRGESLLLETDAAQVETLLATLKRFIIMDKVELTPLGDDQAALAVCGPKAEELLKAAGIAVAGLTPLEISDQELGGLRLSVVRGPEQWPGWHEIWAGSAEAQTIWDKLVAAGAKPAGTEALETWRILQGIPSYGQDIRDRDLPQETGQMQALSFDKGCYIGQEIVERIRSRGQVHRMFTGFEFDSGFPSLGKHDLEGRTVAEITSVTEFAGRNIGLGYARKDALPPDGRIQLGSVATTVVGLPFRI